MSDLQVVRVLCMEDDEGIARLIEKHLRRAGYTVAIARDGEEGLSMYAAGEYDVVLVDQNMPRLSGIEVLRRLLAGDEAPPTIMVTGTGSEAIAVEAMKLGAGDYIVKDVDGGFLNLLPSVITQVLHQRRLARQKREAEEALQRYVLQLEEQNRELDAFAHTVAHDLKGPLAVLLGYSSFLLHERDTLTPEEMEVAFREIGYNVSKMQNIIDELLLLASTRREEVMCSPLSMANIVADACARLKGIAAKHEAQWEIPPEWPAAMGYAPWVEEVWVNYISNGIKYGGIPPRLKLGADVQPDGMVRFWVKDNGAGLTPEERANLFVPFTRLSQIRAKGHGLGLSIVERIVRRLGGEVGVESEPGQGSTFYFTLPAA